MNEWFDHKSNIVKFEQLRSKMMLAAKQYGLTHPRVLRYSQQLDSAHNELNDQALK